MLLKRADDKRPKIVELERLAATVSAGQRAPSNENSALSVQD